MDRSPYTGAVGGYDSTTIAASFAAQHLLLVVVRNIPNHT
ncbi:hypothetical protein M2E15_4971 [Bacillus mycoides]|nr:hypothetical protein bmyco0001_54120 [Bacillus mycoides DSM 2048]KUH40909.1 hypothetical protein M2E15_4971 [Bacillus mycoides]OSY03320.1 hypothetical protein S2E19_03009 [Bacillus mycoides]